MTEAQKDRRAKRLEPVNATELTFDNFSPKASFGEASAYSENRAGGV
jgi:hypothetical protein